MNSKKKKKKKKLPTLILSQVGRFKYCFYIIALISVFHREF